MGYADMPIEQARQHRTSVQAPPDLWEFWDRTLGASRAKAATPTLEPVDTGLSQVTTHDVRFSGFAGEQIAAWLHRPAHLDGDLPVVVRYWGYGRGRGLAHEVPLWTNAGFAVLAMDMRGQGGQYGVGHTPDPHGSGPSHPGFLTRGIESPETYYYRRLMTDAALAVDAVDDIPGLDAARIVAVGGSQGGGIAVAAAALNPKVAGVMADVVFLSDLPRSLQITGTDPYGELSRYLKTQHDAAERAWLTLSYFDVAVLASRASAPAIFSVGLMDPICPPSTVYAAFNAYGGTKEIHEYPYSGHEGGGPWQERQQLAWLSRQPWLAGRET